MEYRLLWVNRLAKLDFQVFIMVLEVRTKMANNLKFIYANRNLYGSGNGGSINGEACDSS